MASQASESSEVAPMNPTIPSPKTIFPCKYCERVYRCPQALGGHQNAHKEERALAKRMAKQKRPNIPLRFLRYPYSRADFRQAMMNNPQPSFDERSSMNNGGFAISEPSNFARLASNSEANIAPTGAAGSGNHNDGSEIDLTLRL